MAFLCSFKQFIKLWHRLHKLYTMFQRSQPLVNLQNRENPLLIPQIICRILPVHLTIHGVLKQNSCEYMLACKGRARHNSGSHFMNQIKHFFIVMIRIFCDTIQSKCFGCTASALIKCGNKPFACVHANTFRILHDTTSFHLLSSYHFFRRKDSKTSCMQRTLSNTKQKIPQTNSVQLLLCEK